MRYQEYLKEIGYKTEHSLWIILAILTISVAASLFFPKKHESHE
jgi:tellurite resistance protein TerC